MESAANQSSKIKPPLQNIVLVGFMGSGKSSIGRELHHNLGYELIDTDQVIEQQSGKTIPEIFEQRGEAVFRNYETELLEHLKDKQTSQHIISTGGGMICSPKNRILLRELGFVVWLQCSSQEILERTSQNKNRPLLQCDDPLHAIKNLLKERSPFYQETAHLEVNTTGLSLDEVSCGILESARYYYGSS
ncbi:MAG: shikimate kinase [Akkermansiaceae bacterium]|nr:shikimate kinase [Akkermansiaceae bacterium]